MRISSVENLRKPLQEEGFTVVPRVLKGNEVDATSDEVEQCISNLAAELGVAKECYTSVVSVWRGSSPVIEALRKRVVNSVAPVMQCLIGDEAGPEKIELIRKPRGRSRPTPCHQDGTYSPDNPYALSVWLALDDVGESSGCLEFLPGSHQDELRSPVDYWKPAFVDDVAQSHRWQRDAITVPVNAGNAVLFMPFVWHRSCPIESNKPRRAIAMRWSRPDEKWSRRIPTPQKTEFGMYNCGEVTWKVLQSAHRELFGTTYEDWESLRDSWQARLENEDIDSLDTEKAVQALERLQILNRAHQNHDAGDQQGIVYAELWNYLLKPLKNRLEGIYGIDGTTRS